jgi:hypothetical protein
VPQNEQQLTHVHRTGILRREVLQVGFLGALGLGFTDGFGSPARADGGAIPARAKRVILVWLPGGPPQMQLWDVKPDSPAECRGTAKAISTSAPGVQIGRWLPQIAKQAHHLAILRSMTLGAEDDNHELGHAKCLTGIDKKPPEAGFYATRKDWPSYGSVIGALRPSQTGLPSAVHLPIRMTLGPGGQPFCGETAGWMGSRTDPWIVTEDPASPNYRVPDLMPLPGMTIDRVGSRRRLLEQIDQCRRDLDRDLSVRQLSDVQSRAFTVTTSRLTRDAFDISQEPAALRDRYGRHTFGQSLLLGRRLVEAGVRFVQVNLGAMNSWDSHNQEEKYLERLTPPYDQGFSALISDLHDRGLLEETLVISMSEMGRNPILGKAVTNAAMNAATPDGRNHWQYVWSVVFAGAGIRGGTVVGKSDDFAGHPDGEGFYPSQVGATIYSALGIDLHTQVYDYEGRPMPINEGEPIAALFRG